MKKTIITYLTAILLPCISLNAQSLSAEDVTMQQDKAAVVSISLDRADGFVATGFYIMLPEGFSFTGDVKDVADNHVVKTFMLNDNKTKVAVYSTENDSFDGLTNLLNLQFSTTNEAGTYQGLLSGIEFASYNLELLNKSSVTFNITVDQTDGIERVQQTEKEGVIYNTSGQQIIQPSGEIYIQNEQKYLSK